MPPLKKRKQKGRARPIKRKLIGTALQKKRKQRHGSGPEKKILNDTLVNLSSTVYATRMRIHTSLTADQVRNMVAGIPNVYLLRDTQHGSRSHARAFDVILTGTAPYRTQGDRDHYAATWDEWGIFLARVFRADPNAKAGAYYANATNFHHKTGYRFVESFTVAQQHRRHRWEWNGGGVNERRCDCGARMSWA